MENRIYTNSLSDGSLVKVVVLNGAQYCSLIGKGEEVGNTDLKTVKAAVKESKSVSTKSKSDAPTATGKPVELKAKDARKQVIAGYTIINKSGKSIPFTVKAEETPNKVFKFLLDEKNKTYYMQ